ncbi:hypothetical protein L9F63_000151, partial [Diploptera punctata]
MADDPERDLLPVKDGGPYEDVYSPHVSKLDRKSLEDRYLRLLMDNENLKKESHKQQEKIKNMLQAHGNILCLKSCKGGQHCECHKKGCEVPVDSVAIKQSQQLSQEVMRLNEEIRIMEQELESQREQHNLRVAELEEELANNIANEERLKIAKNVEMIQLQRSLQQQASQLTANFAKTQVLEREVVRLQQELEASQQENDDLQNQLAKERQKLIDYRHDLQKMDTDRLSIRELEEQVRDLQVTHLEEVLLHEQCECSSLKQKLEEMKQVAAQNETLVGKEKDLQFQVKELESALEVERKEKNSALKILNGNQVKVQNNQQNSDLENELRGKILHLEAKLNEVLNERTEIAQNLKEEKEQVEILKNNQSDLIEKLLDLQTRHSKIEEQLVAVKQLPKESEEKSDQMICTCSQRRVIPPRIPSLEESRSAHKILTVQPVEVSNDAEISHSCTESSVSTSALTENKLYAEPENEEAMKNEIIDDIIKSILAKSESKIPADTEKLTSEHEDTVDESLRMDLPELETVSGEEGISSAADLEESRTDTANKIDVYRELEKCRELLKVQYNLTSLYKKE